MMDYGSLSGENDIEYYLKKEEDYSLISRRESGKFFYEWDEKNTPATILQFKSR
jgi:hypothetical protein